jgi:beta-barrel assembly-enhancing protease
MFPRSEIRRAIASTLASVFLFSCTTAHIRPFDPGQQVRPDTEGEKRLWYASVKMEKSLRKSGQVYEDQKLKHYLQSIMDRLYPQFKGRMRVHILKAPVLNAFAMPNGSIYVNLGLIASLENEAQLATVLAHEGIHFVNKHAALQREHYHNTSGLQLAAALLGVAGLVAELAMVSSVFGYSQYHEREADELGYDRLVAAGYDPREAPRAFQHLITEARANKVAEPFFFATHPKLDTRVQNFNALNEKLGVIKGDCGAAAYQEHVGCLRPMVLQAKIAAGKYEAVIAALNIDNVARLYGPKAMFYLGEAYRLRHAEGDRNKAIACYQTTQKELADFAPVFKSLGILYLKTGAYADAVASFERYLQLTPHGSESEFVRQYIQEANQHKVKP